MSLSIRLLLIKSLLPLPLTVAFISSSIFDALAADNDDDDDLLLTLFPFDSSAFGELHLELFDGDSDVNVVVVSLTVAAVVGDGVAVKSLDFVPIVFANKLLSSDNIDCNVLPLLIPLLA